MQVGARIKALREARGLAQWQLAEIAGVHQTAISRVETNRNSINLATAMNLARALGVSVNDLINEPEAQAVEVA